MLSVDEAQQKIVADIQALTDTEYLSLNKAHGRVVAKDVLSSIDIPPQDNSAMDGYAVRSEEVADKTVCLSVSQRIAAGDVPKALKPGTIARIFTGALIPEGADAVVIQENTEIHEKGKQVYMLVPAKPGDNIRPQAQDISRNQQVVTKGTRLTPRHLALLASIGVAKVPVFRQLNVAILSTGSELTEPGKTLKPGQIYNSNRAMLQSYCEQLGYHVTDLGIIKDNYKTIRSALMHASQVADVIISSGGVSVGEEDHIKPAVEELGSIDLWKVKMKPGKPVTIGEVRDRPFIGLPGNPVSSFVVFQLFGKPMLAALQGATDQVTRQFPVIAGFSKKEVTREEYIRVKLEINSRGKLVAKLFPNQSSGVLSSLVWADGLLKQPIGSQVKKGTQYQFLPFD